MASNKVDQALDNEIKNIQAKSKYSEEWAAIVEQIQEFMNTDRRTWAAATIIVMEEGLKKLKKEGRF